MLSKYLTIFIFLGATFASAQENSPFAACREPILTLKQVPIEPVKSEGDCNSMASAHPLPSWSAMNRFLAKFSRYQSQAPIPNSEMHLLTKVNQRVKFLSKMNLTQLKLQRDCFINQQREGCQEVRSSIKSAVAENWHDMSLGLVLGFQQNSAVRYQFGADKPDLFVFKKTKHPFGGKVPIDLKIISQAQEIFNEKASELGSHIDSGLRDHLQTTYKEKYVSAMLKAPIMAMVQSKNPPDHEIISALDKMIENNQELIEKEFDANDLAGFHPVIEEVLQENPHFCSFAGHWINEKKNRDENLQLIKLGVAGAAGVGCVASAWTGVGLSLCFASGALLAGQGITETYQNRTFERMRTFTSALDSKMIEGFDQLSEAEQSFALEMAMAPLAGLGAGAALRSVAPSSRAIKWLDNLRFNTTQGVRSAQTTQESTPVLRSLESDMKKIRDEYRAAPKDVDVQVCSVNVGAMMCELNVKELLKYAAQKYPDFDISKARVLRIQSGEYVPLYANNATRPVGYNTNMGTVRDYTKKVRSEADGATTWSRHYVLEYEGRILDFDYADDVLPTSAQYFDKMFSDTLNGVVKERASSTYLVRSINAEEYMNSSTTDIYRFETTTTGEQYFFDFYKSLPGAKQNIVAPPIHPDRAYLINSPK